MQNSGNPFCNFFSFSLNHNKAGKAETLPGRARIWKWHIQFSEPTAMGLSVAPERQFAEITKSNYQF